MAQIPTRGAEVESFILAQVEEHPAVKLQAANTTPSVDRMIRRALAHAAEDRGLPKSTGGGAG